MSDQDWNELETAVSNELRDDEGSLVHLWFTLNGRISRHTYWTRFILPMAGLNIAASLIDLAMGLVIPGFGLVGFVTSLALFWPGFVSTVKRLHDLGYPGWLVPAYYGGIVGGVAVTAAAVAVLGEMGLLFGLPFVVLAFMALWLSLKMMFARGVEGPNEYGPDPLERF